MSDPDAPAKKTPVHQLMLKGFFFNLTNPSVILFWIGAVGLTVTQYKNNSLDVGIYFFGTLLTVTIIDVLKALLAVKIKRLLTPSLFVKITKLSGLAIIAFGGVILFKALFYSR